MLLRRAEARRALADEHEAKAVALAVAADAVSIARAADHFIIAAGLRGQARFRA